MARWFSRRWAWAAVVGATVTVALTAGGADAPPQKVGATITLNIDGKGDRQFKVVKCEKQPDGSYHSELKDTKSGEVITLVDQPNAPVGKGTEAPKSAEPPKVPDAPKGSDAPPKAKPRANDPLVPPLSATMPDPAKDKDGDKGKRPLLDRMTGDKDKPAAAPTPPAPEPAKKPGLLARVFGKKTPAPAPAMPAPTAAPGTKPTASSPPPVIPTPPGGLTGGSTTEPPRTMPSKPSAVPSAPPVTTAPPVAAPPGIPAPLPSIPAPLPSPPVATPAPLPAAPVPIPAPLPAAPAPGGGLPPIPVPPGGTSAAQPLQVVVPAGFVPAGVAFDREVEPFVIALQSMTAPSARLTAAKGLADGRHGSTDGVKAVLFQAARLDPCGEVRAACLDHLTRLGYATPQFVAHAQAACGDPDPQVSTAAKAACAKLMPGK